MLEKPPLIISVIGAGAPTAEIAGLAEQVGMELAKRGIVVACGGLGGVMEAVCRGAKSAGGTTIGILPGNDPREANRWVDLPICTGVGFARNVMVVKTGRSVIAVGGSLRHPLRNSPRPRRRYPCHCPQDLDFWEERTGGRVDGPGRGRGRRS